MICDMYTIYYILYADDARRTGLGSPASGRAPTQQKPARCQTNKSPSLSLYIYIYIYIYI